MLIINQLTDMFKLKNNITILFIPWPIIVSYRYIVIQLLCDRTWPGNMQHTHLHTQDKDPMTDQSTNVTEVQLGELISFTVVS